jgi:hypothetical protein
MSADYSILDDVFEVTKKDPDGKKFDRGKRWNLLLTCPRPLLLTFLLGLPLLRTFLLR